MQNLPVLGLQGSLYTDYSGIKRLFEFYHKANEYSNTTIFIDFYHLDWIDANLCALLQSMLYKLNIQNNLFFSSDLNYITEKFNVLFRNGFIDAGDKKPIDSGSAIILKNFSSKDKENFVSYIENDLLSHKGMPKLSEESKCNILHSLIELFNNIDIHSQSEHPFFVCGQFYPKQEKVVFSMVDLGIGFLPPIHTKTKGAVTNAFEAICWALVKRNTTKENSIGGLGLTDLHSYCKKNTGELQIVTGNTYWDSNLESTIFEYREFEKPFVGSMINLFFSCN